MTAEKMLQGAPYALHEDDLRTANTRNVSSCRRCRSMLWTQSKIIAQSSDQEHLMHSLSNQRISETWPVGLERRYALSRKAMQTRDQTRTLGAYQQITVTDHATAASLDVERLHCRSAVTSHPDRHLFCRRLVTVQRGTIQAQSAAFTSNDRPCCPCYRTLTAYCSVPPPAGLYSHSAYRPGA